MKKLFALVSASFLSASLTLAAESDNRMIYCSEDSFADVKAWEVHFENGKIFTRDTIHSIEDATSIQLTRSFDREGLPLPYGIYEGKTAKKKDFELVIHGLDMLNSTERTEYYIARLSVGNDVFEEVTCYTVR